jgi:hypothetical protein
MTKTDTCKFCGSIDIPEDLTCVHMCELCTKRAIDILFDGVGFIRRTLLKRHMRRWRRAQFGDDWLCFDPDYPGYHAYRGD